MCNECIITHLLDLLTLLLSLLSEKVTVKDKTTISMRCSIGDIDPYWEMNNGRYQQLADIGRFNHGFRTGFLKRP